MAREEGEETKLVLMLAFISDHLIILASCVPSWIHTLPAKACLNIIPNSLMYDAYNALCVNQ